MKDEKHPPKLVPPASPQEAGSRAPGSGLQGSARSIEAPSANGRVLWSSITVERRASQPPASSPPSQRKDPRRALELEVEFTEDVQFFAGLTQDISEGGVFIATYRVLKIGTRLTLSFQMPDGCAVTARGEVRWVRDTRQAEVRTGMGVAFTEINQEALDSIVRFCREVPPLYVEF